MRGLSSLQRALLHHLIDNYECEVQAGMTYGSWIFTIGRCDIVFCSGADYETEKTIFESYAKPELDHEIDYADPTSFDKLDAAILACSLM